MEPQQPRITRKRRVLDCLIAAAKKPVPLETLVTAVYLGDPPPSGRTCIMNTISELRASGVPIVFILGRGYLILNLKGKK